MPTLNLPRKRAEKMPTLNDLTWAALVSRCRNNPEWAANKLQHQQRIIDAMRADVLNMQTILKDLGATDES